MKANLLTLNQAEAALWISRAVKAAALCMVLWAVAWVSVGRLNDLREQIAAMPDTGKTTAERMRELDCLTKNIYWEAGSEPFEGKVAVAQVTMNRVDSGRFGSGVCGVVHQKNVVYEKVICQFSWFCEGTHQVKAIHKPHWRESEEVAKKVLLEGFRLPSLKNALYYHADYVNPGWNKPKIDKVGRHIFYGDRS